MLGTRVNEGKKKAGKRQAGMIVENLSVFAPAPEGLGGSRFCSPREQNCRTDKKSTGQTADKRFPEGASRDLRFEI
jgi:hypothetical protein